MGRNRLRILNVAATGLLILGASMIPACQTVVNRDFDCQIRVRNRSEIDINFVVVDSDGVGNQFGYLQSGGRGATAGGCQIWFWRGFAISWEEKGAQRKSLVDVMRYGSKRNQIKSLGFYYLGNDQWQVVARDGITSDSNEVRP